MHLCHRCAALAQRYQARVRRFLRRPPADWMRARGYDVDPVAFARDCEVWKRALRGACADGSKHVPLRP